MVTPVNVAKVPLGRVPTVPEVRGHLLRVMTNRFVTGKTIAVHGGVMLAV